MKWVYSIQHIRPVSEHGMWLIVFPMLFIACETSEKPTSPEDNEPIVETSTYRFTNESEIESWSKADTGSWRIEDGRVVLEGSYDSGEVMNVASDEERYGDVDVSVEIEWLAGDRQSSYGVSVRTGRLGGYVFSLYPGQVYAVGRWGGIIGTRGLNQVGGSLAYTYLVRQRESIVIASSGINEIQVKTEGAKLLFYVNGELLVDVVDESFGRGKVGLFVGGNERVAFDNLIIVNTYEP